MLRGMSGRRAALFAFVLGTAACGGAGSEPASVAGDSNAPRAPSTDAGLGTGAGSSEHTSGTSGTSGSSATSGSGSGTGTSGASAHAGDAGRDAPTMTLGERIATIALENVGDGACSTNSAGGTTYETSCTGNAGSPEYWCADFVQWVWAQAGVDTSSLDAAAGSFYLYGQNNATLHTTPSLGDGVVFNYQGGGVAEHVAIVALVNADGTIETVSGDWGGVGATEAAFASTSQVTWNTPAYPGIEGTSPAIMGMAIAGFVSPAGSGTPLGSSGADGGAGCYSDTLGKEMPDNACVQSASDSAWYQCDSGTWVARDADPTTCNGTYPLP